LLLLTILIIHAHAWAHLLSILIFLKIISWFYIYSFSVYNMPLFTLIELNKFNFIFLGFLSVTKLHFYKSKSSSSLCLFISHHNSICYYTKLLKVVNQIRLLSLKSKTSYKQFYLVIRTFSMKSSCMSCASRY
jgi:hypothetical protein